MPFTMTYKSEGNSETIKGENLEECIKEAWGIISKNLRDMSSDIVVRISDDNGIISISSEEIIEHFLAINHPPQTTNTPLRPCRLCAKVYHYNDMISRQNSKLGGADIEKPQEGEWDNL